jgi:hypothetical protein
MRERELWEQQASFFRRPSMKATPWEPLSQKPSTAVHALRPVFASIEVNTQRPVFPSIEANVQRPIIASIEVPEIEVPEGRHSVAHRFNGGDKAPSNKAP